MVVSRIKKALEDSRSANNYDNQVLKGRAREIFVSDLLVPFLDRSFGVCSGIIIDCIDQHSKQIDIIVYDSNIVPPIMLTAGEGIIPYEAVLATIEVKSKLNYRELEKSVDNARSVKFLKFERLEILKPLCKACLSKTDSKYSLQSPLCCIFAFSSDLKKGSESDRLNKCVKKLNDESKREVDLPISVLCVADRCFTHCIDINSKPPEFSTVEEDDKRNTLEFILNVVNSCNVRAAERERLYWDRYLK
jgi:hypothetical protein